MTEPSFPANLPGVEAAPSAHGVARNSAAIVVGQMLGNVLRTVGTLLLIAALPREEYGALTAVVAFVDPIRNLAVLGIDTVAIRRASASPADLPRVVGTLLRVRLGLAFLALTVAVAAGVTVRADAPGGWFAILCAAVGVLPGAFYGTVEASFQTRQQMRRLVLVPAASSAAVVATVAVLWSVRAPMPLFLAAGALGDVVAAALAWRLGRHELVGGDARLGFDRATARGLIVEGLPLAYVSVVVMIYSRAGFLLLERSSDLGAVADLGAASKLVNPILLVGSAVSVSVAPYATRLSVGRSLDEFRAFFRRFLLRVAVWVLPCVAIAVMTAPLVIRALKPEFEGAAIAFRWLAFGSVSMLVCQVSSSCLVGLGRFRAIAVFATLNLGVFLGLAIPLAPRAGAEGVAIATFAMETLNAVLQSALVFRLLRRG
jgi:O-antigen/teichoic acid export membrane protein